MESKLKKKQCPFDALYLFMYFSTHGMIMMMEVHVLLLDHVYLSEPVNTCLIWTHSTHVVIYIPLLLFHVTWQSTPRHNTLGTEAVTAK